MTEPREPSRRDWLSWILRSIVAASGVVLLYPVALFLRPRRQTQSGALEVVAPIGLNQLKLERQKLFDFGGKPCLVVSTPDGEVRAFNAACTHLDCTVGFRPDHGDIFCQCHLGVYDLDGRNISGPPPRPLETYKVTLRPSNTPGQEEIVVSHTA